MAKKNKNKKKKEFSKALLIQESILIWIITFGFLILAGLSLVKGYNNEFPWLTAMAACPWTAYAVSQGFYYNKAKAENKIKLRKEYELTQEEVEDVYQEVESEQEELNN